MKTIEVTILNPKAEVILKDMVKKFDCYSKAIKKYFTICFK